MTTFLLIALYGIIISCEKVNAFVSAHYSIQASEAPFDWATSKALNALSTEEYKYDEVFIGDERNQDQIMNLSRSMRYFLLSSIFVVSSFFIEVTKCEAGVGDILSAAAKNSEITYSQNAKNMNRLSAGDSSGGSVYNNNPTSDVAKKRRALTGCKSDLARKQLGDISEKDCNLRVFDGDYEYVLSALRALDCPTCPYGIGKP